MTEKKTLQQKDPPVCEAFRVAEEERSSIGTFLEHATPYNYGEAASKDPSDTKPLIPPSIETAKPVRLSDDARRRNALRGLLRRGEDSTG